MFPRYADAEMTYRGKSIKTELDDYATGITYTDPASSESDTFTLQMADPDELWIGPWYPTHGDKITGSITVYNWERAGDTRRVSCGSFTFDDFEPNVGGSTTVSISGVSVPADDAFGDTPNSKTWEDVTIQQIAQDIASRASLTLMYDAGEVKLESREQSKEPDQSFLDTLCKEYGLSLKVYNDRLVIFDREQYKAKPTVHTFTRENTKPASFRHKLKGTYTGGEIVYTDGDAEEEVKFTLGGGKRIFRMNEKVDNDADAERKLRCAVNDANHEALTVSFSAMGNPDLVAGQTALLSGFKKLDGKYYINSVTHNVRGADYSCSYELSKVYPSI